MNITRPQGTISEWPKCSFFGVYDGHGGHSVADYLRDQLHQYILKDPSFTSNPKQALLNGCKQAEAFLHNQFTPHQKDKSGSCAVVVLIIDDMCYIGNIGDCRVIMSGEKGNKIYQITRDHKPSDPIEQTRIESSGGQVYQSRIATGLSKNALPSLLQQQKEHLGLELELSPYDNKYYLLGPHRVLPGRLSVARTFGDLEAKRPETNGNPNVLIAVPEISHFKITDDLDFMILGSDGLYDKNTNKEIINGIWQVTNTLNESTIHSHCARVVEHVMAQTIASQTLDNITCCFIAFQSYADYYKKYSNYKDNQPNDHIYKTNNSCSLNKQHASNQYSNANNDNNNVNHDNRYSKSVKKVQDHRFKNLMDPNFINPKQSQRKEK